MKPEIIKADTAGMIVSWDNGNDVYYVGDTTPPFGNGVAYKDSRAFENRQGICYIPEYGFFDEIGIDENVSDEMLDWMNRRKNISGYVSDGAGGYTYEDIRYAVESWENGELNDIITDDKIFDSFIDWVTEQVFEIIDWQHPETYLNEIDDPITQWDNYIEVIGYDPRLRKKTIQECLDYLLEDDETDTGGIPYVGYTLRDFLLEENGGTLDDIIMDADVSSLDVTLKMAGIKPIK